MDLVVAVFQFLGLNTFGTQNAAFDGVWNPAGITRRRCEAR